VIALNCVFEHVPDVDAMLDSFVAYLAPGGSVMLNVPVASGFMFKASRALYRVRVRYPFDRIWQKGFVSPHLHYFSATNLARLADKLYFGGPVALESVSFLVRADTPPEHAIQVLGGVYLSSDRELLGKLLERDKPMEGLRILVGYSGWGPGQLEAEITRGDWTIAPADANAIFNAKSEHPWPDLPQEGVGPRT